MYFNSTCQYKAFSFTLIVYRDGKAIVLVYSITSRQSFERLPVFFEAITKSRRGQETVVALVGNKCDKEDEREVSTDEGDAKAKEMGIPFFETSAKTSENIDRVFCTVMELAFAQRTNGARADGGSNGAEKRTRIGRENGSKKKKYVGCIIA